jgi:protocatechuate 3,4-dioxygenase beta subunit
MNRHFPAVVSALCLVAVPIAARAGQVQIQQQIQVAPPGNPGDPPMPFPMNRPAKTGTGRIKGRVVSGETGSPVRRAQVRISGPDIGSKAAMTDGDGRYEFRDLPAGRFTLNVMKSGYVSMQYGQNRPFEPGRPIELGEAQVMDKADVSLPRGSVLSGRVVDEFGEPVADAMVSAMRMQYMNGRRRLMNAGRTAQSNDLGQFRLYGLPPGEYYVSATLRSMDVMFDMMGSQGGPVGSNPGSGYAATYYPGTSSPSDAQRVTVAVGQELASVDIALQPVKLTKISGTALGSDGKPMAGAMVMLMPAMRDAMLFMPGGSSRTSRDGQFTLSNVVPGEYSLQVRSMGPMFTEMGGGGAMVFAINSDGPAGAAAAGPRQEAEFAAVPVSVSGEDINGLLVVATRGAKAAGRLVFEGGSKPEGLTTVRITAPSVDPEGGPAPTMSAGPVKADGSFEMSGLIGTRVFRLANLPKGWYLKNVRVGGAEVTDTGVEFKAGEEVTGIDIELTQKTTAISGGVSDGRGQPVKDYTVVVFTDDQQKWTLPMNRWIASARPDQDGRFKFNNLPAGTYQAIALEYVAQGEWADPDWLERARSRATRFTLDEGGVKTLDLKLSN